MLKKGAQEGNRQELGKIKTASQKWGFRGACLEGENGMWGTN